MRYGNIKSTKVIDDLGSTEVVSTDFHDEMSIMKTSYAIRKRIPLTDTLTVDGLLQELIANGDAHDRHLVIEINSKGIQNGMIDAVSCYTLFEQK